jgi:hypothetical protein
MIAVQAAAALGLAALNGYLAGGALGWWRVFGVNISMRLRLRYSCRNGSLVRSHGVRH